MARNRNGRKQKNSGKQPRYTRKGSPAMSSLSAKDELFRRVMIKGTLTLNSELHIGSGLPAEKDTQNKDQEQENSQEKDGNDTCVNEVQRDATGKPFLPGSGLRGALAAQLDEQTPDGLHRRLFGLARQPATEDKKESKEDQGGMGLLRVYDALLMGQVKTDRRTRTRIEPVSGTAMQHHLATLNLVPEGTQFKLRVMLEHSGGKESAITSKELECVLTLLEGLSQQRLGSGKSIGQGQVTWRCEDVQVITEKGYREWILSRLEQDNSADSHSSETSLESYKEDYTAAGNTSCDGLKPLKWERKAFSLKPDGPILINDPEALRDRKEGDPHVTFMTRSERSAVIPGSTLKGWFRAQSRRILLTLLQDKEMAQAERVARADELLNKMFGSTNSGMGCLRFEDAFAPFKKETDEHLQMFNAIDRFTGGVKESALFSAKGLWTNESFYSGISYQPYVLESEAWMKLLLLYVWQDAKEGDLVLGWGKSKGYGRLTLKAVNTGWLEKPGSEELEQWQDALLKALEPVTERV
ncbi:MAG: hypothetical protein CSB47_10905 [Proteobacteria bacterium]|nr:MAG: hypothetical protein CSB47_10905 [Pseudomonadota bacterium]